MMDTKEDESVSDASSDQEEEDVVSSSVASGIAEAMAALGEDASEAVRLFERAFAEQPWVRSHFREEYARAVSAWAGSSAEDAMCRWVRCCRYWPENDLLLLSLGRCASKRGLDLEARAAFRSANRVSQDEKLRDLAVECERRANSRLVEAWHWRMLDDRDRNAALAEAIKRAKDASITAEFRVLEIGAGAGLIALAARSAGATSVTAIERSRALAAVATRVFALNKVNDIDLIVDDSSSLLLDDDDSSFPFELVVAEVVDAGLFGEGALRTLSHAARLGKDVLPSAATLRGVGVQSEVLRRRRPVSGDDEAYDVASLDATPHLALTNVFEFPKIDLLQTTPGHIGTTSMTVQQEGRLDALVVWFQLDLGHGVTLSTAPEVYDDDDDQEEGHFRGDSWQQAVFYVPDLALKPGQQLRVAASVEALFFSPGYNKDSPSDVLRLRLLEPLAPLPSSQTKAAQQQASPRDLERYRDGVFLEVHSGAVRPRSPKKLLEVGFGATFLLGDTTPLLQVTRCATGIDAFSDDDGTYPAAGGENDIFRDLLSLARKKKISKFDGLLHKFVDASGAPRAGGLADLDVARRFLLRPEAKVAPSKAAARGVLTESRALAAAHYVRHSRSRTLGFDLSPLDDFATPHARDIEIFRREKNTFDSRPRLDAFLSEAAPLFDLDFNANYTTEEEEEDNDSSLVPSLGPLETAAAIPTDVDFPVTQSGTAHALLVWWHLDFPALFSQEDSTLLSTGPLLDAALTAGNNENLSSSHWRCSGFILNGGSGVALRAGDTLRLRLAFRHSNIHVLAHERRTRPTTGKNT